MVWFSACLDTTRTYALEQILVWLNQTVPRSSPQGWEDEDDSGGARPSLDPRSFNLLAATTALVLDAEGCFEKLESVRTHFQETTAESLGNWRLARERLEALQEEARRCIALGATAVGAAMDAAWERDAETDALLQASSNADGFRAAVEAFLTAERAAESAVERNRQDREREEREKREREEREAREKKEAEERQVRLATEKALEERQRIASEATGFQVICFTHYSTTFLRSRFQVLC